jgi:hypothetical protein
MSSILDITFENNEFFLPSMLLRISEAAIRLGVCVKTLRRWEAAGILQPRRTVGSHRRYDPDALLQHSLK